MMDVILDLFIKPILGLGGICLIGYLLLKFFVDFPEWVKEQAKNAENERYKLEVAQTHENEEKIASARLGSFLQITESRKQEWEQLKRMKSYEAIISEAEKHDSPLEIPAEYWKNDENEYWLKERAERGDIYAIDLIWRHEQSRINYEIMEKKPLLESSFREEEFAHEIGQTQRGNDYGLYKYCTSYSYKWGYDALCKYRNITGNKDSLRNWLLRARESVWSILMNGRKYPWLGCYVAEITGWLLKDFEYSEKDEDCYVDWLTYSAQRGYWKAQFLLGKFFAGQEIATKHHQLSNGRNLYTQVSYKNEEMAVYWLEEAALTFLMKKGRIGSEDLSDLRSMYWGLTRRDIVSIVEERRKSCS